MNVWDRYVRALHATDLRGSTIEETNLDLVHASGWSQRQRGGLAAMLYRARANPETNLSTVRDALRTFAMSEMQRECPEFADPKHAAKAADRVFYDLLKAKCKSCNGVRFLVEPGTSRLSDIACPACQGSGELSEPRDDDFTHSLRGTIGRKLDTFARSMASKLRD